MATDARKRQKKLERRKAKERSKKKELARRDPRNIALRMERSSAAPILHCCTTDVLWQQGMSNVLVSRELTHGNVAYVIFLLDVYCLGVKDVILEIASRSLYERQVYDKMFRAFAKIDLEPSATRKLIEGAVEYAGGLGLPPHPDYRKAELIFGDIDASACSDEFVYGKDGKPFFIAGPHDTEARCSQVMSILAHECGPDGFDYLIPLEEAPAQSDTERILMIDEAGQLKVAS